jgi:hypothetical protein
MIVVVVVVVVVVVGVVVVVVVVVAAVAAAVFVAVVVVVVMVMYNPLSCTAKQNCAIGRNVEPHYPLMLSVTHPNTFFQRIVPHFFRLIYISYLLFTPSLAHVTRLRLIIQLDRPFSFFL